jgi:pyruvate formate lyase activating enzyme
MPESLQTLVDRRSREGILYEKLPDNKVRCFACGHRCLIFPEQRGICKVRYNHQGRLQVPHGYVATIQCDPTEKKPYFHVLPGSRSLTFGMLGCDFHCPYCQNWEISQAIRDPESGTEPIDVSPQKMSDIARQLSASLVVSSYNEPLITSEWAIEIFKTARVNGFITGYVSNGNATKEVLEFIRPYTDCYKVDLKGMKQENYRELGGKVSIVLETIARLVEMKFWVEIVTLTIPGFNDSDEELKEIAKFLVSVSPAIPWHITAFHKDYKMTDPDNTPASTLIRGANIGLEAGLKFVYAGNLPGQVGDFENTYCPSCRHLLVRRYGFKVLEMNVKPDGHCPKCKALIPGIWY